MHYMLQANIVTNSAAKCHDTIQHCVAKHLHNNYHLLSSNIV